MKSGSHRNGTNGAGAVKPYHKIGTAIGTPVPSHLHLRWPWTHRRKMKVVMGNCEDTTLERFELVGDLPYYDGSQRLRRALAWVLTRPVIGEAAGGLLRYFIMLETALVKTGMATKSAASVQA